MSDIVMDEYRQRLLKMLEREYELASEVRKRTNSPINRVESVFADTMEKRVELLVGPEGVAEKINR
ncbi:MAG: hypothetical protein QXI97_03200, partial [Nitrososphaerota archaeon]